MTFAAHPQDTRFKRRLKLFYLVPLAFLLIPYNMGGYLYEQLKEVIRTAINSWWHEPQEPMEIASQIKQGMLEFNKALIHLAKQLENVKVEKVAKQEKTNADNTGNRGP